MNFSDLCVIALSVTLASRTKDPQGDAADVEYNYNEITRGLRVKEI